jgi:hypothetical protein
MLTSGDSMGKQIGMVCLLLILVGCSSQDDKSAVDQSTREPAMAAFGDWDPGQRLNPYLLLKPGATVSDVRQLFPEMGEPQAEGGSPTLKQRGLTEFSTQVTFNGKPVGAEFNFRRDTLYSYYFTVGQSEWSRNDRNQWHRMLVEEWTRSFGSTEPEEQAEGAYQATSHFWKRGEFDAVITESVTGNQPPIISWGIQEPRNR